MRPSKDVLERALEVAVRCSPAGEGSIWWAAKVLAAELHYSGEREAQMKRAVKDLEKKRGNQRRQILDLTANKS